MAKANKRICSRSTPLARTVRRIADTTAARPHAAPTRRGTDHHQFSSTVAKRETKPGEKGLSTVKALGSKSGEL